MGEDLHPLFLRVGTTENAEPMLEIRMQVTDLKIIQSLISAAFHNQPLIFAPQFRDRIKAISSLQEKGIIGRFDTENGEKEYRFLF